MMAEVCMKCLEIDLYIIAKVPIAIRITPGIAGIRALVLLLAMRYWPINPTATRRRPNIREILGIVKRCRLKFIRQAWHDVLYKNAS